MHCVQFSLLVLFSVSGGLHDCISMQQNYTGDRLNFGLAAEQAKSEGYKVEVLYYLSCQIIFNKIRLTV